MKILLADDDHKRRLALFSHLVESNLAHACDIAEADSTDGAKKLLAASFFDVLILDVVLPKRTGDTPDQNHGLALLGQLTRTRTLNKPDKIIGITAYLDDIATYRQQFSEHCLTVIEANARSTGWRSKVVNALSYAESSRAERLIATSNLRAITIHGIRTFGEWQSKLKNVAHEKVGEIPFHDYKYGYFSTAAFLLPFMRKREVARLTKHLKSLFAKYPDSKFIIFSHSCGTYLIANALRDLTKEGNKVPLKMLVLAGSVLSRKFNWSWMSAINARLVNDCADEDRILWLSEAAVLGVGMAGKTGFCGFQDHWITNRYFSGGHSSYFEGDFMERYWVPLFTCEGDVLSVDVRNSSTFMHEIVEKLVYFCGAIKPLIYFLACAYLFFILFKIF